MYNNWFSAKNDGGICNIPCGRFGHCSNIQNDTVIVFGGMSNESFCDNKMQIGNFNNSQSHDVFNLNTFNLMKSIEYDDVKSDLIKFNVQEDDDVKKRVKADVDDSDKYFDEN